MQLAARRVDPRDALLAILSPENQLRLKTRQPLEITGSRGTKFLVYHGYSGIVRELTPDGGYSYGWCALPDWRRCDLGADAHYISMAAQVLMIQADEDAFRDVAEN